MTKDIDDEDDLLAELDEELDDIAKGDLDPPGSREELGLEDADAVADEIDEAPEEVGLDVETLDGAAGGEETFDDDEDLTSALDDSKLDLDTDFDDDDKEDEDGWTAESEGSAGSWDEDLLDEDDDEPADDGGLEGVEDPTLDDFVDEEGESSFPIDGDDLNADDELERVELDLG